MVHVYTFIQFSEYHLHIIRYALAACLTNLPIASEANKFIFCYVTRSPDAGHPLGQQCSRPFCLSVLPSTAHGLSPYGHKMAAPHTCSISSSSTKKVMRRVDRIHKRKVNFLINSQWIFFFLILLARTGVNNFPSCKEVRKCIVTVCVWWKSKKSQLSVVNFWKRNMNKQLTVSGTEIKQYSYPKGKQEKLFVLSVQMMGR